MKYKNANMVGLAEILQNYFGCTKPFLDRPKIKSSDDGELEYEHFTKKGASAYGELIDLVYALRNIGALTDKECDSTVDTLDMIASGWGY